MKLRYTFFPFAIFALSACDQTDVKKEAYDQGFAEGQASMKAQLAATPRKAATPAPRLGMAPATPVPPVTDPQIGRILPNSKLRGTALDQKPKTR